MTETARCTPHWPARAVRLTLSAAGPRSVINQ